MTPRVTEEKDLRQTIRVDLSEGLWAFLRLLWAPEVRSQFDDPTSFPFHGFLISDKRRPTAGSPDMENNSLEPAMNELRRSSIRKFENANAEREWQFQERSNILGFTFKRMSSISNEVQILKQWRETVLEGNDWRTLAVQHSVTKDPL
jgi:hypothetical protein